MKLAIITPYWKSDQGGGITTYTTGLVDTLNEISDIDIRIGFMEGKGELEYKISEKRISSIFSSIKVLKRIRPEIIQVHEDWGLLFGSGIYKIFNRDVKLIFKPLTEPEIPTSISKKIKAFFKRVIYRWSFKKCNYIVVGSEVFIKIFKTIFDISVEDKLVCIYPGIKEKEVLDSDREDFRKKFHIKKNSKIILIQAFTATEIKAKGAALSIEVLKRLLSYDPNIILILTRKGKYVQQLQNKSNKENVSKNVIFTGDLENPFIPLQLCDVFLWPWLGESGFGLALLEAMIVGKPIVATSETGKLEPLFNGKNALIVKPTVEAIYKALLKLMEDNDLAQTFGKNARETVLDNYTWEKIGKKFIELYKK